MKPKHTSILLSILTAPSGTIVIPYLDFANSF